MEMLARFWSAAAEVDARAGGLDEARRFDFCTREGLLALATSAGLSDIAVGPVTIETPFADFAELWRPFTLGTGPAPGYLASLDAEARRRLEARARRTPRPGADPPLRAGVGRARKCLTIGPGTRHQSPESARHGHSANFKKALKQLSAVRDTGAARTR